jgi:hypothetical protein
MNHRNKMSLGGGQDVRKDSKQYSCSSPSVSLMHCKRSVGIACDRMFGREDSAHSLTLEKE